MRMGACDAKRGSSMLPSPLAPAPERERTLMCARQHFLSSPPHGRAIEHSLLAPYLPLQARAESRGFAADSRAADALGGAACSWRAVGLSSSAPRLAPPSSYLASRSNLHRLDPPSRAANATCRGHCRHARRLRHYLRRAHSILPPKRAKCTFLWFGRSHRSPLSMVSPAWSLH